MAVLLLVLSAPAALARAWSSATHASAHSGLLYPMPAGHAGAAGSSSTAPVVTARGARRIPRSGSAATAPASHAPASSIGLSAPSASLLANFNGVSSRDSALTNFGAEFEPPDQGLCAGNGYVVEMVNSAYTVYKPDGTVVTGPFNVNGPFDEGLSEFTSDPRCQYDAATHTWYATILFINSANTASRVDLAVNTSGDPTKAWTSYQINTTGTGGATGPQHAGCPCFGDQPTLGIDAYNIYITTNEFSILGPQFNGAQVYAVAKRDLVQAGPSALPAHFVHFDELSIGGSIANSIQPALTTGSSPAEYFLSSLDPHGTGDQRLGVWAMTHRSLVAAGGTPTLSSVVMPSEVYSIPPAAEQKGSPSVLDAGDDRMQQTQFIGGHIWGELDTAVNVANDPTLRAGAAWFEVTPTLSNGVISAAAPRAQGYVASAKHYVLYPALQTTRSGATAMVFTLSGADIFPSAAYAVKPSGQSAFGNATVAAAGTTNYDPNATRWGDYSWAVLDPDATSVWMATEYVPPKPSQTPDGRRNWGTRVLRLSP